MFNVKVLKLVSGEEIVGTIAESDQEDGICLNKPYALQVQTDPRNGRQGLVLVPWFLSSPDISQVTISKAAIAAGPVSPIEVVAEQYTQQTSVLDLSSSAKALIK